MDEERDQPHFPFDEGRSFTLRIEVAEEGFRTYVNGKPYVNFSHRLDLGNVHYLYLTEGAEFYDISYQDRYVCYDSYCNKRYDVSGVNKDYCIFVHRRK